MLLEQRDYFASQILARCQKEMGGRSGGCKEAGKELDGGESHYQANYNLMHFLMNF